MPPLTTTAFEIHLFQMPLLTTTAFEIHLFQMLSLSTTAFELSKFYRWFQRRLAEVASFQDNASRLGPGKKAIFYFLM